MRLDMWTDYAYNECEPKVRIILKGGEKYEIKRTKNADIDGREEIVKEG